MRFSTAGRLFYWTGYYRQAEFKPFAALFPLGELSPQNCFNKFHE